MSEIEKFIAQGLYFELAPIILLGIFAGLAKFFARDDDPEQEANWRDFFYHAISSMVVCVIIYALLDSTNLSYMSRFAVAGLVAFFGIDKAIDYAQKILALRGGGGGNSHEVHKRDNQNPQNPSQNQKREDSYYE